MVMHEEDLVPHLLSDAEHLLDLLDLLPDEDDDSFWDRLARAENPDQADGGYFFNKLIHARSDLRRMLSGNGSITPSNLESVSQYVLMFFDRDDPAMHMALEPVAGFAIEPGRVGRRWSEDICATAWRLYAPCRATWRRRSAPPGTRTGPLADDTRELELFG